MEAIEDALDEFPVLDVEQVPFLGTLWCALAPVFDPSFRTAQTPDAHGLAGGGCPQGRGTWTLCRLPGKRSVGHTNRGVRRRVRLVPDGGESLEHRPSSEEGLRHDHTLICRL